MAARASCLTLTVLAHHGLAGTPAHGFGIVGSWLAGQPAARRGLPAGRCSSGARRAADRPELTCESQAPRPERNSGFRFGGPAGRCRPDGSAATPRRRGCQRPAVSVLPAEAVGACRPRDAGDVAVGRVAEERRCRGTCCRSPRRPSRRTGSAWPVPTSASRPCTAVALGPDTARGSAPGTVVVEAVVHHGVVAAPEIDMPVPTGPAAAARRPGHWGCCCRGRSCP